MGLKDKQLLYELYWNARQPHTKLAKKLKVSKQVIRYRIKRLEEQEILKSYHAVIDWRRLGYNAIRVYVKWHNLNYDEEQEIYKEIKKDPFFMWTVKFEGDVDIGFYIWVKSIPEFSGKWFKFLAKYKKYVHSYEIYESVDMVHYPMKPLLSKFKTDEIVLGREKKVNYDEIDYNILKLVTENAQMPITEIAKKIKLTPKSALYRLRNLEKKGIILGYFAFIDTNKLGYRFYKIDFYLEDMSRIKEMFEFAKQHKNIVYRMRTVGGPDFEIELMVEDVVKMREIVNDIRKRFPNVIEEYKIHRFEYTIKQIYLPGE